MNALMVKLKEEHDNLKQEEVVSVIHSIDRKRKGFVLDFSLKSFFLEFSEEGCHPTVKKLVSILKAGRISLPEYLKSHTERSGLIQYKNLVRLLENESMKDR
jgi:hypothetical protein